jgi:succinate dehydrogenase hydrophobic anchor subunit
MDKSQIITLLINAVVTILTTAIVLRLSLNKGKLEVASKLKARFTPKVKAYIRLILSLLILVSMVMGMYYSLRDSSPPTRFDVFVVTFNTMGTMGWFFFTAYLFGRLLRIYDEEKQAQAKPDLPTNL